MMPSLSKEKAFQLLIKLITDLEDKKPYLEKPGRIDEWKAKHQELTLAIETLSSRDKLWLSEKYELWFKKRFADPKKMAAYLPKMFGQDVPK